MADKVLSPEQCRILELLRQRWLEKPLMTFGELINQLVYLCEGHTDTEYMTNEKFIESLQKGWRRL